MTPADQIKTARALAALAKPLVSRLGGLARTGARVLSDFRPGSRLTAPLRQFAASTARQGAAADAYKASLGKWGQRALGAGQFVTGVAPQVGLIGGIASGAITPWAMPVWNTTMNTGRAAGQMLGWRDPNQTRQWMEQGANDLVLGMHQTLQQADMPTRMQILGLMNQGQFVDPSSRVGQMAAGQQPGMANFLPSHWAPNAVGHNGDMSGWLLQQAMNKGASMTKAARARALMGMVRGIGSGIGRMFGRGAPQAAPSLAAKWGWRGAKGLAAGAALPLGVGTAGGFFNADLDAQNAGSELAMARMQQAMQQTGGLKRFAVAMDPSLMLQQAGQVSPGLFNRYRQLYGQDFQPGWLGQLKQWGEGLGQELKNPTFLAADSSGIRNITTT